MNVLVRFLREHPRAVDRLAEGEVVPVDRVVDVITRGFTFPYDLARDFRDAVTSAGPLGDMLTTAYLPVIDADRWRAQLESAAPADQPWEWLRSREWVTFARGEHSPRGLSLPDDGNRDEMRLSFFSRERSPRRVSIEYARGPDSASGIALSFPYGCSLPDWGECVGTECGGDCQLKRVHDDDDGLVCRCPHMHE